MAPDSVRVIGRGSPLSLIQIQEAIDSIQGLWPAGAPGFSVLTMPSLGDRDHSISLLDGSAPTDLFTREIDAAILRGEADLAVHSAKDLPTPLLPDLCVAALLPARDQSDSLVLATGHSPPRSLADLTGGARIGTSSSLRRAELLAARPDLAIVPIRGTIGERIGLVDTGEIDGVIVATCALDRLGLSARASLRLSFRTHELQGHLALVCRRQRADLRARLASLDVRRAWGRVVVQLQDGEWSGDEPAADHRLNAVVDAVRSGATVELALPAGRLQQTLHYLAERLIPVAGGGGPKNSPWTWYAGLEAEAVWREAGVVHHPLIELLPGSEARRLATALDSLPAGAWCLFTSRSAVRLCLESAADRLSAALVRGARLVAVGESTAASLRAAGLKVDVVGVPASSAGVCRALGAVARPGELVLHPTSDQGGLVLAGKLAEIGLRVERLELYRTQAVAARPAIDLTSLDEIVVSSPSVARALKSWFPSLPGSVLLTPWGKPTADELAVGFPGHPIGPPELDRSARENRPAAGARPREVPAGAVRG